MTRRDRGVSLLELVVAIAVLGIGTLAALRALDRTTAQIGAGTPRLLAMIVARNRAEELALVGAAAGRSLPATVRMGHHDWRIAVAETATAAGLVEATVAVTADGQPGATLVAYVAAGPAPAPAPPPAPASAEPPR